MGHEHNLSVAWIRFWSALGAEIAAERVFIDGPLAEVARELAAFELRRLTNATHALSTTTSL